MTTREVHATLDIADRDLSIAERSLDGDRILEGAAYSVQQAAEKHVKAALTSISIAYPQFGMRGHDNALLASLIPATHPFRAPADALVVVKPWATGFRYADAATGPIAIPTETELRAIINDIRAFGRLVDGSLPPPRSSFVQALKPAAAARGARNRIDLLLTMTEIKDLLAGAASFPGHDAAMAVKDHARVAEVARVGTKVVRTGIVLEGADALQHLAAIGGTAKNLTHRIPLDALAVDDLAAAASGALAASLDELAKATAARQARWTRRSLAKEKPAKQKDQASGRKP